MMKCGCRHALLLPESSAPTVGEGQSLSWIQGVHMASDSVGCLLSFPHPVGVVVTTLRLTLLRYDMYDSTHCCAVCSIKRAVINVPSHGTSTTSPGRAPPSPPESPGPFALSPLSTLRHSRVEATPYLCEPCQFQSIRSSDIVLDPPKIPSLPRIHPFL